MLLDDTHAVLTLREFADLEELVPGMNLQPAQGEYFRMADPYTHRDKDVELWALGCWEGGPNPIKWRRILVEHQ